MCAVCGIILELTAGTTTPPQPKELMDRSRAGWSRNQFELVLWYEGIYAGQRLEYGKYDGVGEGAKGS